MEGETPETFARAQTTTQRSDVGCPTWDRQGDRPVWNASSTGQFESLRVRLAMAHAHFFSRNRTYETFQFTKSDQRTLT